MTVTLGTYRDFTHDIKSHVRGGWSRVRRFRAEWGVEAAGGILSTLESLEALKGLSM